MSHAKEFYITIFMIVGMATIGKGKIELNEEEENINVLDFGAVGDGRADDTQAFQKAWEQACGIKSDKVNFIIENDKKFLVKAIRFNGPCQSSSIHVQILGTIVAPSSFEDWGDVNSDAWMVFTSIDGLTVRGGGTIDGQGSIWWQQVDSRNHIPRRPIMFGPNAAENKGPDALRFSQCNNLKLDNFQSVNPPKRHIVIFECTDTIITNINLVAPDESPNTDGIGISQSTRLQIHDSNIRTGDDCIAVSRGSSYINITKIECGPGHGISIGSLGEDGGTDEVEEVHVANCIFTGSDNGARIKTWQGGAGFARKISFRDITLNNVRNPIIIDQYYCPHEECSNKTHLAVKVSEISFMGVRGTSSSDTVINLSCDETEPCHDILLEDIDIKPAEQGDVSSYCLNAYGKSQDTAPQVDCLNKQS